uniref:Uncharacterized protein n=1 Tax=Pipistrellus kuhlii TaxID=59472 RepID=A0A7J8B2D4_PIPKU|nr:hypothetical protein mPipKuh1_007814 [Pipistrellus kuhlii]
MYKCYYVPGILCKQFTSINTLEAQCMKFVHGAGGGGMGGDPQRMLRPAVGHPSHNPGLLALNWSPAWLPLTSPPAGLVTPNCPHQPSHPSLPPCQPDCPQLPPLPTWLPPTVPLPHLAGWSVPPMQPACSVDWSSLGSALGSWAADIGSLSAPRTGLGWLGGRGD